ncbi:MAG: nucleotidyl transferase AbiEii/AbiGii toxin family protein [Bdellovibrio sp.]|nr:nucleotidyl transferase AbiEii/AbiGii toxin family protein [Bdellovibrio sp.]
MRLKVEVNNGENFTVFDLQKRRIEAQSIWFQGKAEVSTYSVEELLGTKLRALYQRKKGRDLYDMAIALERFPTLDLAKIVQSMQQYLAHEKKRVSRAQFEENLAGKMKDQTFLNDIAPLLRPDAPSFDPVDAYQRILTTLIAQLPGEPWKGNEGPVIL